MIITVDIDITFANIPKEALKELKSKPINKLIEIEVYMFLEIVAEKINQNYFKWKDNINGRSNQWGCIACSSNINIPAAL